jgi:hypothetical protein
LGFLILLGSLVYAFAPDFHSRPGALVGHLPALADSVASGEIANTFGKNLGWSDGQTVRFKTFLQGHRSDIESAKQTVQRSALKMAATTITTLGVVTHSHWIWMLALLAVWRVWTTGFRPV